MLPKTSLHWALRLSQLYSFSPTQTGPNCEYGTVRLQRAVIIPLGKILKNLISGEELENLFLEFDKHETKEALFAYQCDKLECDIQSKLYDEFVDLNNQEGNETVNNNLVQEIMAEGGTFSDMWIKFGQRKYPYDENFMAVSQYVLKNKIK